VILVVGSFVFTKLREALMILLILADLHAHTRALPAYDAGLTEDGSAIGYMYAH
jgi:hypothetical protein